MVSLLQKICAVDEECGTLFKDSCITEDEDIQQLCYDALKEIIPGGGKKIIQRSKVWKIIESSLKCEKLKTEIVVSSPSSSLSLASSGCSSPSVEVESKHEPHKKIKMVNRKMIINRPDYQIYSDVDIIAGANAGEFSKDSRLKLIRGTIHNMLAAASLPPFNRLPSTAELEEMAKSMVVTYSCLRDTETDHGVIFKQLKRRISNVKPVKNPQGPCLKKKKYEVKIEDGAEKPNENLEEKKADTPSTSRPLNLDSSDSDEISDNKEMIQRHFNAIKKEMLKKKPDMTVVNSYLNKEYQARRNWLLIVPAPERCKELLNAYPCFKDHVEVVEEARRVMGVSVSHRNTFVAESVTRLIEELDLFIYFGIHAKGLIPPKSPKLDVKIIHLLKNLTSIFSRQKVPKKPFEMVYELKDHEDPDCWSKKQQGNLPVLVYDKDTAYVIVGTHILFGIERKKFVEATVGLLATYYLLDFDYPKHNELGMNILQYFVFMDKNMPKDISSPFKIMLKAYEDYKLE